MKILKYLMVLALIGIIIGAVIAYQMYHKPHRDITKEKAAFVLTSDELFDDYEADMNSGDQKYIDRVIEISGTVSSVREIADENISLISLGAQNAMIGGVNLTFNDASVAGKVQTGSTLTAKCRCTGMLMEVILVECILLN